MSIPSKLTVKRDRVKLTESTILNDELDEKVILITLNRLNVINAAFTLDKTRTIVVKNSKIHEDVWKNVWTSMSRSKGLPFWAEPGSISSKVHLPSQWARDTNIISLTERRPGNSLPFPNRYMHICFYYLAYAQSLVKYVAEQKKSDDGDVFDINIHVDLYHTIVDEVGRNMKAHKSKTLRVAIYKRRRGNKNTKIHIRQELFGSGASALSNERLSQRPYIPFYYFFHSWSAVELDGLAMRLPLSLPEIHWISQNWRGSMSAIRLQNLQSTQIIPNLTYEGLSQLSITNGPILVNPFEGLDLVEGVDEGKLLSTMKVKKLYIINCPRLETLPEVLKGTSVLHLESLPKIPSSDITNIIQSTSKTAKTLVLHSVKTPKNMRNLVKDHTKLDEVVYENLNRVETLPTEMSGKLPTRITLAGIQTTQIEFNSFFSNILKEVKSLTLKSLSVGEATMNIPTQGDMTKDQMEKMFMSQHTIYSMKDCTFRGFSIRDFRIILRGSRYIENLTILNVTGRELTKRLLLPTKSMIKFESITLPKNNIITMSPSTLAWYSKRQETVDTHKSKAAKRQLPFSEKASKEESSKSLQVPVGTNDVSSSTTTTRDDEEVQVYIDEKSPPIDDGMGVLDVIGEGYSDEEFSKEMLEGLLKMRRPFGTRRLRSKNIDIPGWFPSNLEKLSADIRKEVFALWINWEQEVVDWLIDSEEGLLIDVADPDSMRAKSKDESGVFLIKSVEEDDTGNPSILTFTSQVDKSRSDQMEFIAFMSDLVRHRSNFVFTFFREARFVGRDDEKNIDVESDTINMSYPLELFDNDNIDGARIGVEFEEMSINYVKMDDGRYKKRIPFTYRNARAKCDFMLGNLDLYYDNDGDSIPQGFQIRVGVATALRFFAIQNATAISAVKSASRGGISFEDRIKVNEDKFLYSHRKVRLPGMVYDMPLWQFAIQNKWLSFLGTVDSILKSNPRDLGESRPRKINKVRYDQRRSLYAGTMLMVYTQAIGMRYLVKSARPGISKSLLILNGSLRSHMMEDLSLAMLPMLSWITAWFPAEPAEGLSDSLKVIKTHALAMIVRIEELVSYASSRSVEGYSKLVDELITGVNPLFLDARNGLSDAIVNLEEGGDGLIDAKSLLQLWDLDGMISKKLRPISKVLDSAVEHAYSHALDQEDTPENGDDIDEKLLFSMLLDKITVNLLASTLGALPSLLNEIVLIVDHQVQEKNDEIIFPDKKSPPIKKMKQNAREEMANSPEAVSEKLPKIGSPLRKATVRLDRMEDGSAFNESVILYDDMFTGADEIQTRERQKIFSGIIIDDSDSSDSDSDEINTEIDIGIRICSACGNNGPSKECPCKGVYYCDGTCQLAHWVIHKSSHILHE